MSAEHPANPMSFAIIKDLKITRTESHLTLEGHLDAEGAPILSDVLSRKLETGVSNVVLDFARVQFISSTGIGTLIAAIGEFRDVGGDVIVKSLSNELREVFEMLDLLDYVTVG
jgi:anti-anti-sigma factor